MRVGRTVLYGLYHNRQRLQGFSVRFFWAPVSPAHGCDRQNSATYHTDGFMR